MSHLNCVTRRRFAVVLSGAIACSMVVAPALAAVDLSARAFVGIEQNANPYELSTGRPVPGTGQTKRDDSSTKIAASFSAQTGTTPNLFKISGQAERINYRRFDDLDHWEYTVAANLDWKLSNAFDTTWLASREQTPAQLADVGGGNAPLQTKTLVRATFRLRPVSQWQISLTPAWLLNELPLPGVPDFHFREKSGGAALDYLGAGRFVPGLGYDRVDGKFFGIVDATRYRQQTYKATGRYKATGFSTFTLAAGYTTRSTNLVEASNNPQARELEGKSSAFTGDLYYDRAFSVKTNVYLGVFRNFEHYDAGVNSAVGTGYSVGANWAPTVKLALALEHRHTWTNIDAFGLAATVATRKDELNSYSASLLYSLSKRLSVRPYFARRVRTSNAAASAYSNTIYGVELSGMID